MAYIEDRVVHDADSHVMETVDWLEPFLDSATGSRLKGLLDAGFGAKRSAEIAKADNEILAIVKAASLKPNNKGPLEQAASKVGAATKKLASSQDGSGLAMLDGLIPSETIGTSYSD